ncbi:MAG TPA: GIY-YIG nuclease family protein [Patescibacteria group bacterium]|jgi:putative endonuclease|nr:GIY-YIG nuclease family protein [Patescibacteria group bacterium]
MAKYFYVYILCSEKYGTLYIGMTSNLAKRLWEHQNEVIEGFTQKYKVHKLIYFEKYDSFEPAALREKRLKAWKRDWKIRLIEEHNPHWLDLSAGISA